MSEQIQEVSSSVQSAPGSPDSVNSTVNTLPYNPTNGGPSTLRELVHAVENEVGAPILTLNSGGCPGLLVYCRDEEPHYFDDRVDIAVATCEEDTVEIVNNRRVKPCRAERDGNRFKFLAICEMCEDLSLAGSSVDIRQPKICHHIQTKTNEKQRLHDKATKTTNIFRKIPRIRVRANKAFRLGIRICFTATCKRGNEPAFNTGVTWQPEPGPEEDAPMEQEDPNGQH